MYDELAPWWPLLSAPDDYAEEAAFYERVLVDHGGRGTRDVLELGSGGGNNASHMKRRFRLTLVDASPGMLEHSRALNPGCAHVEGDMRDVRLGRRFDAVFIHDAIDYMTTREDLRRALETAWIHTAAGGVGLFCPDHVRESFRPGTHHGGHDGADGRGLRFVEWTWDPDPEDETCVADYAFLLRHEDGRVEAIHDRHVHGLFSRDVWLRTFEEAGWASARSLPFEHSELEPGSHEVFVARKG